MFSNTQNYNFYFTDRQISRSGVFKIEIYKWLRSNHFWLPAKLIVYPISSTIRESYNVTLRYDSTELPLTLDRWFFSEVNYLKSDTFGCRFPASFNLWRRESLLTPFFSTNANHVSIVYYMSSMAYNQHSRFNILLICFLYSNKGDHCIKCRLVTFFVRFRISSICMTISSPCNESFIVYTITTG